MTGSHRSFEAVLFDLDGTLIDSAPDLGAAADKMRTDRGMPSLPLERYRPMAGSGARDMLGVAIEEMGHLAAVWNITSALGGSPRFGRMNFPLDPGGLPANVVVRLAPFGEAVLQHFIYLERPDCSNEPDGDGFVADFQFKRSDARPRVTPTRVPACSDSSSPAC